MVGHTYRCNIVIKKYTGIIDIRLGIEFTWGRSEREGTQRESCSLENVLFLEPCGGNTGAYCIILYIFWHIKYYILLKEVIPKK